ncbi:MAG: universal stress protein [Bacteroidales bacterium]|nr:universal stress protein [Bacteroidales bacterium]
MREVVLAIDFSKNSIHALEYAIGFVNMVGADLTLLWVDTQSAQEPVFSNKANEFRVEAKQNLENTCQKYKSRITGGTLTYKLRKGKVYQEVAIYAKQSGTDLIITGTHGITGFEEFWIGSNAYRIVSYAPCPVITIRQDYEIKPGINRILLPVDSTLDTKQKAPFAVDIAKAFNSELYLLALQSTPMKTVQRKVNNHLRQIEEFIKEQNCNYVSETIQTENMTRTVLKYAEKINTDLIAIMTEQEHSSHNILLGPGAQQVVNHSLIPVMSIQPKEIYAEALR